MTRDECMTMEEGWQKEVFTSFYQQFTDRKEKYPCYLGTAGLKEDMMRFSFFDNTTLENIEKLYEALENYQKINRELGIYTAFVSFFNISRDLTEAEYQQQFWQILNQLTELDRHPWPEHISTSPEDPTWEFSIAGEPMFVVCTTPAYRRRKSRKSTTFMMTFQPHWVFEEIGFYTKKGETIRKTVANLIAQYDEEEKYPYLGTYGDENNLEWLQYFLPDVNEDVPKTCPFHKQVKEKVSR